MGARKSPRGAFRCYAETLSKRNPATLGVWGPGGTRVVAAEARWAQVAGWDRAAGKAGVRYRVFCASLADVFEDWDGPMVDAKGRTLYAFPDGKWAGRDFVPMVARPLTMAEVRARLFRLILGTPHLDWLLLTKRPENIARLWPVGHEFTGPGAIEWPNLWLGTTVESQEMAARRTHAILKVPAAVRFVSVEPMLEHIDLNRVEALCETWRKGITIGTYLDWVICGGESGPRARPFDLAWARDLRDQCKASGTAYFFKQAGSNPVGPRHERLAMLGQVPASPDGPTSWKLRDSHGGDLDELPADLRIREFPRMEATVG